MSLQIPAFESARALVTGDVMLDRNGYGRVSRVTDIVERPGGAGNVLEQRLFPANVQCLSKHR